jgi:hypothetical protein
MSTPRTSVNTRYQVLVESGDQEAIYAFPKICRITNCFNLMCIMIALNDYQGKGLHCIYQIDPLLFLAQTLIITLLLR